MPIEVVASERAFDHHIANLSEDEQRVIRLRYLERKSFIVIGDLLGRTPEAARRIWARAVVKLNAMEHPAP